MCVWYKSAVELSLIFGQDEATISLQQHLFDIDLQRRRNVNESSRVGSTQQSAQEWVCVGCERGRRRQLDEVLSDENADEIAAVAEGMQSVGAVDDEPDVDLSSTLANLTLVAPFLDNWDGTYMAKFDFTEQNTLYEASATDRENLNGEQLLPPDWKFSKPGRYAFRIFHGKGPSEDYKPLHIHDQKMWHLNMHHIDCVDSRAFADPTGARCQCIPGYAPPEPCHVGDRHCSCYSCKSEYSERHRSVNGQSCQPCPPGETADEHGINCICERGYYSQLQHGIISCVDDEFKPDIFRNAQPDQYRRLSQFHSRKESASESARVCLECPADCLDCLSGNEPTVKQGYALSMKRLEHDGHTTACTIALQDGGPLLTKCLNILRCRPDRVETHIGVGETSLTYQCLGGPLSSKSLQCAAGYAGQLCGACEDDYGRQDGNKCVKCSDAKKPWVIFTIVLIVVAVAGFGFLLFLYLRSKLPDRVEMNFLPSMDDSDAALQEGLFDHVNPILVQDDETATEGTGSSVAQAVQETTPLELAGDLLRGFAFVALQPIKIIITHMQIASLLGTVLHFNFPPILTAVLSFFRPLIAAINGVIGECATFSTCTCLR